VNFSFIVQFHSTFFSTLEASDIITYCVNQLPTDW